MTFVLKIPLSASDVQHINDLDQTVTITQSNPNPSARALPVAWVAFNPFTSNELTWEVPVSIYASKSQVKGNVKINQMSTSEYPASSGKLYRFEKNLFTGPFPNGGAAGTYYTKNENHESLTFGLTQSCLLNGDLLGDGPAPLSISAVGNGQDATFEIESNIWVYLSSVTDNGTVITSVSSEALQLTMLENDPVTLEFDRENNKFKQHLKAPARLAGRH